MVVEVRLFATFREGRFNERELELPEGSSLSDLLELLRIPERDAKVLIVNGLATSAEHELNDYPYQTLVTPGIGCGYLPSGPGRTGGSASQV